MVQPPNNLRTFQALRQVVEALRGPDGCPWDKEQTHSTLTPYAIEEAFELIEAIESGSQTDLIEELGDYLLQVVLHAEIARQDNRFTLEDVLEAINSKMVRRHPHVFGAETVQNSAEVLDNWAVLKSAEKPKAKDSFHMPVGLPGLQKAQKIGRKTQDFAFDWTDPRDVLAKVEEELQELREALNQGDLRAKTHEIGDLLFSVAQLARHHDLDAEQALREANRRFETRFFSMIRLARETGVIALGLDAAEELQRFKRLEPAQKEALWGEVKKQEKLKTPPESAR